MFLAYFRRERFDISVVNSRVKAYRLCPKWVIRDTSVGCRSLPVCAQLRTWRCNAITNAGANFGCKARPWLAKGKVANSLSAAWPQAIPRTHNPQALSSYGLAGATCGATNGSVRCTTPSAYIYFGRRKTQHRREDVRGVVADRRRSAPDAAWCQRHLRHHAEDPDGHTRLTIEYRDGHFASRIVLVVILVPHVEHPRATNLSRVHRGFHLKCCVLGAIVAQPSVEFTPLLRVDRRRVFRAFVVAVGHGVKPEERRHSIVDGAAERADIDPAIAAFERIVRLETRRAIPGMPGDRPLASEDRQRIAIGLGNRFILREVDYLSPPVPARSS
jgi:hypothetical protein